MFQSKASRRLFAVLWVPILNDPLAPQADGYHPQFSFPDPPVEGSAQACKPKRAIGVISILRLLTWSFFACVASVLVQTKSSKVIFRVHALTLARPGRGTTCYVGYLHTSCLCAILIKTKKALLQKDNFSLKCVFTA